MILHFAGSVGNNSSLLFHDDFYVACTHCKLESCAQYSASWVTWELNSSFDIGSTFWKFTRCTTRGEVSRSWVTWSHNSSQSAGENSYLLFYDDFLFLLRSSTLSLLRRTTRILFYEWHENSGFQKIPETTHSSSFRLHLYLLYILQVSAKYDARQVLCY